MKASENVRNIASTKQKDMPLPIGKLRVKTLTEEPYYVIPMPGATYFWTVTGGEITVGQNSPQIMVKWGPPRGDGRVDVMTTVQGNPSNSEGITIIIDPDEGD